MMTCSVVKNFILLLHARHESVLGYIRAPRLVLGIGSPDLVFQGLNIARQETFQTKICSLLRGEGTAFVQIRCLKQCRALS